MMFLLASNKRLVFYLTFAFWCVLLLPCCFAQEFPEKSNKLVYDFADLISNSEEAGLEDKLENYHDTTSTQIAIVTITSLEGYDVSDYAFKLGEKWGIGQKGKNNGVLILITKKEHDIFIATGYGVEGGLPDALCRRIEEELIIPEFKQGNFFKGLNDGTDAIFKALAGEYKAEPEKNYNQKRRPFTTGIIIVIIIIAIIILRNRGGGRGGRGWRTGSFYGGGGGWGGFSSGGSSWGSGSWGGSSGGGGFGGFGGGSFGGGGAGGKW